MSTPAKTIKIFLSSPVDVAEERFAAKRVIERLQEQFAYYGHIEKVLSEEKPLPATETPQKSLPAPSDTDIVVVLLWSRLGTPILDEHYRERPGGPPRTGTEWEFYDAAKSYHATGRPFLLVYRKMAKVLVDLDDKAELERRQEQKRMLEEFERRWFRGTESAWKGYYHPFATTAELETLLEQIWASGCASNSPTTVLAMIRLPAGNGSRARSEVLLFSMLTTLGFFVAAPRRCQSCALS
jgi:hypothetical protein